MSQEKAVYRVTPKKGVIRQSCFKSFNDGFTPPQPSEIKQLFALLNFNKRQVAESVGLKDPRTVGKWIAEDVTFAGNKNAMPYAAWRLLLNIAGIVNDSKEQSTSPKGSH